ncbi:MAG: hypothetical protein ACOCUY_02030 [Verrucomicrobiota bacterium]
MFFSLIPMLLTLNGLGAMPEMDAAQAQAAYTTISEHLEEGGSFYQIRYVSGTAERTLKRLAAVIEEESGEKEGKTVETIGGLVEESGILSLEGMGASVAAAENDLSSSRIFWMVAPEEREKPVWQGLLGKASDAGDMLKYLPKKTELCWMLNADSNAIWDFAQKVMLQLAADGDPDQLADMIDKLAKRDFSPVMLADSLTGRAVLSLQLDSDTKMPLPLGREMTQISMPSFVAVIEVDNDRFQTELARMLTKEWGFSETKQELGEETVVSYQPTRPMPVPLMISLHRADDFLIVGSNLGVLESALAAATEGDGLAARGPFQSVVDNKTQNTHGFAYVGEGMAHLLNETRDQAMNQERVMRNSPAALLGLFDAFPEHPTGWIATSDDAGYLLEGRGNGLMPMLVTSGNPYWLMPIVGLATKQVRRTARAARQQSCIHNLRMINNAKQQWALENNRSQDDTPTWEDIMPYLEKKPECPEGGEYKIQPIEQPPTCSKDGPEHQLP